MQTDWWKPNSEVILSWIVRQSSVFDLQGRLSAFVVSLRLKLMKRRLDFCLNCGPCCPLPAFDWNRLINGGPVGGWFFSDRGEQIRVKRNVAYATFLFMMMVSVTLVIVSGPLSSTDAQDGSGVISGLLGSESSSGSQDNIDVNGDESRFIVKDGFEQNDVLYTLFSDGTASATGSKDKKKITTIDSTITYDGKDYVLTMIGGLGNKFSGEVISEIDDPFVIPDTVTILGASAFVYNTALKAVVIGSGVQVISGSAFASCTGLEKITFSEKSVLKTIENGAFTGCTELKEIVLPDSLESVGTSVFSSVEEVTVGKNLSSLGSKAFGRYIKSISIPSENTSYSFDDNTLYGLQSGVKVSLIQSWSSVDSFTIPEGVEFIEDGAFIYSPGIKTLEIPSSCKIVGSRLFIEDEKQTVTIALTKVVIGNCNELTIKDQAFKKPSSSTSSLNTIEFDSSACNIVYIGNEAFKSNDSSSYIAQFGENKKSIKIPSSTRYIGDEAFYNNSATTISFMKNSKIQTIGVKSFYTNSNYTRYTGVDLGDCSSLKAIPDSCFEVTGTKNPVSVYTVSLPDGLEEIGNNAFKTTKVTTFSIVIPSSVKVIGKMAFEGISSLSFEKNSQLESYGLKAFQHNSSAKNAASADKKIVFDFSNCMKLHIFEVPDSGITNAVKYDLRYPSGVLLEGKGTAPSYFKNFSEQILLGPSDQSYFVSEIQISESLRAVPLYYLVGEVKTIGVKGNESNPYFAVQDGALYLIRGGNAILIKVANRETDFTLPEKITNNNTTYNVVEVCENAFNGCSDLKRIFIGHDLEMSDSALGSGEIACKATLLLNGDGDKLASKFETSKCLIYKQYGLGYAYLDSEIVESCNIGDSKIELSYIGGYTTYDSSVTVNGVEAVADSWNSLNYTSSEKQLIISVEPKSRNVRDIEIQFIAEGGIDADGSDRTTVKIPRGMTILDSEIPYFYKDCSEAKWMYNDSPYDFNSIVNEPLTLRVDWVARNPSITSVSSQDGSVSMMSNGVVVASGSLIASGSTIYIIGEPRLNYEVAGWTIRTGQSEWVSSDAELEITITGDTTVTPHFRYYQSSSVLPSISDNEKAPKYFEIEPSGYPKLDKSSLQLQWTIGGDVDTSMATWTGGVSIPLIVDKYVYVRQADHIFKIDSQTGYAVADCASETATGFYHSLAYGNGVIFDVKSGCAFDLDLKQIFTVSETLSSVYYDKGMFYTIIGKTLYGFDSKDSDPSKADEVKELSVITQLPSAQVAAFGNSSEPVFYDGCLYLLSSAGSSRSIVAISLKDKSVNSFALTGLDNYLFDDGWLTYYKGRIYSTCYVQGLFGDYYAKGNASIISIGVSGTEMSDLRITPIEGVTSILSKFVIHEGRGYVNACKGSTGALYVYNVSENGDLEYVYNVASTRSHGSIVVNVSESNEKNGNLVTIYLLPYGTDSQILFFTDNVNATKGESVKKYDYAGTSAPRQYCSQAVRIGLDGQLIWYNDSGQLMSFVKPADNHYYVFVQDGDSGKWYDSTGNTAYDALSKLGDDTLSFEPDTNALKTVNGESADGFRMYVVEYGNLSEATFSEPVEIQNLADSSHNVHHYYIITNGTGTPSEGSSWKYLDDELVLSDYTFLYNVGETVVVDRNMAVSGKESVVSFYDEGKLIGKDLGAIGSKSTLITPPELKKDGAVVLWKGLPDVFAMSSYNVDARGVPTLGVDTSIKDGMYTISTTLIKGDAEYSDAKDLNIVLALRYDDKVAWTFTEIDWAKSTSFSYSVSYSDLTSATLMVVDGSSFMNCDMLAIAECDLAS